MARIKSPSIQRTPWSYIAGTTPLHRIPAGIKLILLLVLSASPVFGPYYALGAAALIFIGSIVAGIKIRLLLSGSLPLIILLFFFSVLRAFDGLSFNIASMLSGLYFALGILICFAAASLFFSVTTISEIRSTLARAEVMLFRRQSRISLAFALMLGFLPRFFECWENAHLAARARCCKNGLKLVMIILPLVTERMIDTAAETAEALESRGYKS